MFDFRFRYVDTVVVLQYIQRKRHYVDESLGNSASETSNVCNAVTYVTLVYFSTVSCFRYRSFDAATVIFSSSNVNFAPSNIVTFFPSFENVDTELLRLLDCCHKRPRAVCVPL